jgi:S1-C subfamily serine protease
VLGIRVTGLLNAHPLRSLGMKNGDVVTRIGGMAIVDEESARRAADVVRAADAVDLELLRSGAPLTVHVTIR